MLKTALNEIHRELGAQLVEFAGYEMPLKYTSINEEHTTVRDKVGLFDLSHMGEFLLSGPKAAAFVDYLVTNRVANLEPGEIVYSPMCYPDGGIVDDLLIYRLAADELMLVVNAANIDKDWEWVREHLPAEGVEARNLSRETTLIAVQGPLAEEVLAAVTALDLSAIPFYGWVRGAVAGAPELLVSRTGYTGEDGFEIYLPNEHAETVWRALWPVNTDRGGAAIGLGARDTLRLEMKYCLYGNDIDKTTNPLEAGLKWTVKLKKDDFIGKEALQRVKAEKVSRKLICFEMQERGIARHGAECYDEEGGAIGHVTSGTMSPSLGKAIGLAYLSRGHTKSGSGFLVDIRGKHRRAVVVKPPFYQEGSRK
jgi:aminomethyltransferase